MWARVRSRLMECVWMGGLDGADLTGIVRQVRRCLCRCGCRVEMMPSLLCEWRVCRCYKYRCGERTDASCAKR